MRLNSEARVQLEAAGISEADWARQNYFSDGQWHGDACGCPDDRCIGLHHNADDDCGCLPTLLPDIFLFHHDTTDACTACTLLADDPS